MPPPVVADASLRALRAVTQAASDAESAWQLMPRRSDAAIAKARVQLGRYRAHAAPSRAATQMCAELRDQASDAQARLGSALRLLSSAEQRLAEARAISRKARLPRQVTPQQLSDLAASGPLAPEVKQFLDDYGVGPPAVAALVDESLRRLAARAQTALQDVVRLTVTAEVSGLASRQRAARTEKTALSDIVEAAKSSAVEEQERHEQLHGALKDSSVSDRDIADEALLIADESLQTAQNLAPFVVGLDQWAARSGGRLRFRGDIAKTALSLTSTLRAALLDFAAATSIALAFASGSAALTRIWRKAAEGRPLGGLSDLDGTTDTVGGTATAWVTGVVSSLIPVQVNADKAITILRLERGADAATTAVLPYFAPLYVGLTVGTIARLRLATSDDVLAEFTNANTSTQLASLSTEWGTKAGGLVQRRDLAAESTTSWTMWLARQVRPSFDALPNSIDGTWTWGRWFALSIATGSLS